MVWFLVAAVTAVAITGACVKRSCRYTRFSSVFRLGPRRWWLAEQNLRIYYDAEGTLWSCEDADDPYSLYDHPSPELRKEVGETVWADLYWDSSEYPVRGSN